MNKRIGKVILVGAGPGDPELITVKGYRLLQLANVVVHDRLVSNEMLNLCHPDAELIDVGKYPDHHRITQDQINEILVEKALAGQTVVRLKGGDPFVFGRGMEELESCRAAGIQCEIVPGISSCIAGPASVGVPVTTRGHARSFAIMTGQTDPNLPDHRPDFEALANIDTVVFMMGRRNLRQLAQSLIDAGRGVDTPVTCIQQATMSGQKAITGTLSDIAELADQYKLSSPVITIVGHVASLADQRMLLNGISATTELQTISKQPIG